MCTRRGEDSLVKLEATCSLLLCELQEIWDEVGGCQKERDTVLLEIEQECVEAYRMRVDTAYQCRAQLRQVIADSEAELAQIYSALGERPSHPKQSDVMGLSLKEELNVILPRLEEMRKRKAARKKQFGEVMEQIWEISSEMCSLCDGPINRYLDENDLSLKKLEELHSSLHSLQKQKNDCLKQVLEHLRNLRSLCSVLGVDFKEKVCKIHPDLHDSNGTRNISDETIRKLSSAIESLKEVKIQRLEKLQDLASTMVELWNLMNTPSEEKLMFQNVTAKIAASEDEICEADSLSLNFLSYVESEVWRLETLKSSKLKDFLLKKKSDLEDTCQKAHMILDPHNTRQYSTEVIESGVVDLAYLLDQIESTIADAKEEAFSRKDILEKTDKWLAACKEECWLEEYNRDDNRYNAGRGAHLSLKRAEKARVLVNKIPAMVDGLTMKTKAWREERGTDFLYDGVPLVSMTEQYNNLRQEKEQEHQRQREERRLQGQLLAKQEALFGSKPSPTKSVKKGPRNSMGGAAYGRYSLGGQVLQRSKSVKEDAHTTTNKPNCMNQNYNGYQPDGGKRSVLTSIFHSNKRHPRPSTGPETQSPFIRNPLSPVPTAVSVKAYTKSSQVRENKAQVTTTCVSHTNTPASTPSKLTSAARDQDIFSAPNKARTPASATSPPTFCIPMETFTTPSSPYIMPSSVVDAAKVIGQDIEYSFEEIKAGFGYTERKAKSLLQV
ncbi:hypothetical protein Droror1_Dr00027690 [Drosera rotundifolia]